MDFSIFPRKNKTYAGANGSKISIDINGEMYMIKFPPFPSINKEMSYANSCICEYLGSHVFEIVGIPAQKTILGTFVSNGKEKIVVACKDFTSSETVLQDFASVKNTIIDSEHNGYGTELADVLKAIDEQQIIEIEKLREFFWDMFIIDALIGNWDRHNGNWGFLYNKKTDEMNIAPVFDCGSSLFPQADEKIMQSVLNDEAERNARIFLRPLSGLKQNGQKINYYDFITSLSNKECNEALIRMMPKIDMNEIDKMIEETPYISSLQKKFYKTILHERKEKILDRAFNLLKKQK